MEYVFIAMASGYEDTRVLGVYSYLDKALEVAEKFIKKYKYAKYEGFDIGSVAKAKVNGKIVCYYARSEDTGEIVSFKE